MKVRYIIIVLIFMFCFGCSSPEQPAQQTNKKQAGEQVVQNDNGTTNNNSKDEREEQSDTPASNEKTRVHFLDVGQADCIYAELSNNNDILIDAGNEGDGDYIVNYLKNQDVDDIEMFVLTHPHEDHIGGAPAVLDAFKVEKILDSGYLTDTQTCAEYRSGVKVEAAKHMEDKHRTYQFGDVKLEVLTGNRSWDDTNNYSVVSRLDVGNIEFMFTGDAESAVENNLTGNLEAEVLKVAHHGSSSSTTDSFLNKVAPDVSIICVGEDNRYGHPDPETVKRLNNTGSKVYCTDVHGNIIVTTDGNTFSVALENQASPVTVRNTQQEQKQDTQSSGQGRYVGSVNSDKYHNPDCRWAESIHKDNEIWFKSKNDASAQGYEPCGTCKP